MTMKKTYLGAVNGIGVVIWSGNTGDSRRSYIPAAMPRSEVYWLAYTLSGSARIRPEVEGAPSFVRLTGESSDEMPDLPRCWFSTTHEEEGTREVCIFPVDESGAMVPTPFGKVVHRGVSSFLLQQGRSAVVVGGVARALGNDCPAPSVLHAENGPISVEFPEGGGVLLEVWRMPA